MSAKIAYTERMSRPRHVPSADFPYHVTTRSTNREKYPLRPSDMWMIYCDYLWLTHVLYEVKIHSFVMMPNHFHLLISTPLANLSEAMRFFISQSSKEVNKLAGRINQVQGARFFRSLIKSPHYFSHAYKYVYRNPVKANICRLAEDYPYSTLQMLCGLQSIKFPLEQDSELMNDLGGTLAWINREPNSADWSTVRNAMRHAEFRLARCTHTKQEHYLETVRL